MAGVVMKTLIENPQGWLVSSCVLIFIVVMVITLIFLIFSSLGYEIGNMSFWTTAFSSELSFIIGLLMGGNLREKHS